MIKKSLTLGLTALLMALPANGSAQDLNTNTTDYRIIMQAIDRVMAKFPEKIECLNLIGGPPTNVGDFSTVHMSAQSYIFRLTNTNLKFAGAYQISESNPSLVIYSMNSGGSAINLIVKVDSRTWEGSILAISGNLPQPNTCQVGMKVAN